MTYALYFPTEDVIAQLSGVCPIPMKIVVGQMWYRYQTLNFIPLALTFVHLY